MEHAFRYSSLAARKPSSP
jgi:hypothetical protein